MDLAMLFNATELTLMNTGYSIGLDFLGQFARVIIEGVGIIGLGIIVFTLVLKAITLPFDIYQRVKMRKQTLIMRNMKDDLEKLQKQYANDKTTYNQKMYELQKKNGYSMLGACLPMIVSLVILIVAFQGFRAYSDYANLQTFSIMSDRFNEAVLEHCPDGKDYHLPREGEDDGLTLAFEDGWTTTSDGIVYRMYVSGEDKFLEVKSEDSALFIYYIYNYENSATGCERTYFVDEERLLPLFNEEERAAYDAAENKETYIRQYVFAPGSEAAAEYFRTEGPSFLWIGNVWYPDVSYDHPLPSYDSITNQFKNVTVPSSGEPKQLSELMSEPQYNYLVANLTDEQSAANGYYILIILSVGLMVLSQFVSMRSNKESNKYQTVDGKGARTQKIMMVMLPLIYAVFAFMYSAAFSIYMIVSSAFSIIVTLLSNLIIGHVFNKKEEAKFREENSRTLPWMDKYGKNAGKDKSKDKKAEKPEKDKTKKRK